ncbi:hypothetical protein TURU_142447 [Turdus rufiventris]|nr:hypothetical protein TURU_142447 [Turdus rufiventris]
MGPPWLYSPDVPGSHKQQIEEKHGKYNSGQHEHEQSEPHGMNSGRSKNGGVPVPCKGKPKKGLNPDGAFLIYQMLHIQQFTDKMVRLPQTASTEMMLHLINLQVDV